MHIASHFSSPLFLGEQALCRLIILPRYFLFYSVYLSCFQALRLSLSQKEMNGKSIWLNWIDTCFQILTFHSEEYFTVKILFFLAVCFW